ncbi:MULTISPECIES: hypothetical protein [unclassified Nocardia]|uniref:hypothetical protein n=1 Tax=unclassified Nocardia TaxID=2637762 RepID=UPI001CE47DD1|nr:MULTISPECIES: hypothetical protein [unclassified Nocardia]
MNAYEAPGIPSGGENPNNWSHKEILHTFEVQKPENAAPASQKYGQLWQMWEQGLETFNRSIQKSISDAWSGGKAAPLAMDAIRNYVKNAHELSGPISEMQSRVEEASAAVGMTKSGIPGLVEGDQHWYNPFSWGKNGEKSEKLQEAREAMEKDFVKPMGVIDAKIPVFPTPNNPTNPVDIPQAPPGGWDWQSGVPGNGVPGNGVPGNGVPGVKPGGDDTGKDTGKDKDKNKDQPGTEPKTGQPTGTNPTSTNPTSTNPSPKQPTTPTGLDPTKTNPTGLNPSTPIPSTPGLPRSTPGVPSTPGNTPKTAAPRQSLPGLAGTAAAANQAAAAARGATGAQGAFGGMPGAAGKGKGDEDSEHKIPDWLINQENTDELLGEQPKTLPGGVIGTNPEFKDS